jgi:ABC-type multidrug transport system permease subunit
MANNNSKSGGVGFFSLLFLLFLGLKLTNNIDWSWWWVTSPLWLPITIVIGVIMIVLMFKD